MKLQSILESLLAFDANSQIIENACVCEFSAEDSTPTIHLTLWRGHNLSDIPDTGLDIVAEGFSDIGRVYSLQNSSL
jgi:hypothetical protein